MDQIIKVFHLDLKLLVAQFINFLVVFAVLYFFAIKPITKLMNERTQKIEKGLKNANEFDIKLQELSLKEENILNNAKKQASDILSETIEKSEIQKRESLEKTKEDVKTIIIKAKNEIAELKHQTINEIKNDSISFVIDVTEKVLKDLINIKVDTKIIEKAITEIKNQKM